MSAAVEAQYPAEDDYAEDEFEDDFESEDTSSPEDTPLRAAHSTDAGAGAAVVAAAALNPVEVVPHRSSSANSSKSYSSSSSSSSSRASAATPPSHKSNIDSRSQSSVSSHRACPVSDNRSDKAVEGAAVAAVYPTETSAAEAAVGAADVYDAEDNDDNDDVGVVRRADGSLSEPRSHTAQKTTGKNAAAAAAVGASGSRKRDDNGAPTVSPSAERRRVQRPEVPQNAEELEKMQAENAKLRDVLFEKNREQYHASLVQSTKCAHGMSTAGGGSFNNTAATAGGGSSQRDAAARLVQESLMAHRTLQTLRLERRDLTQRRDELKKLVSQYKRASKYRELVEGVKQDIIGYQEEYRDVQLEVRCNEKLLLLAEHMSESGVGDRRVQEEIRAQNALTQRRREHALRDADAEQRRRDAAAQRVEELQAELERRQEAARTSKTSVPTDLLMENRAKKERLRELRARLQEAEAVERASATSRQEHYRTQQSVRDDAEREYLQNRIAEMRRELGVTGAAAAADTGVVTSTSLNSGRGERGANTPLREACHTPSSAHSSRKATSSPPPAVRAAETGAEVKAEAASATPPTPAADEQPATVPNAATEEIDVTAWLNAHPVAAVTDPAETLRPTSAGIHQYDELSADHHVNSNNDNNALSPANDTAAQNVHAPPLSQPLYTQEPATEQHAPVSAAHAAAEETPAWLGGGLDDVGANAGGVTAAAATHPAEESDSGHFEEEEVVDDEEELEKPDEPKPEHVTGGAVAAPAEPANEDDGPDWLNF